jgi:hypothetical protein
MNNANIFAYIIIYAWPLVTLYLLNKYKLIKGALISLIAAYTLLPALFTIDLPGLPAFDKFSITILTIVAYMIIKGNRFGINSLSMGPKIAVFLFVFAPLATALTNGESYMFISGLKLYDGISMVINNVIYVIPFLLGVRYFRTYDDQVVIFKYFSVAIFIYAILALYEIRMSPQLHNNFYGYFPQDWRQQVRSGGFRAVVFLGHGLLVALFLACGVGFWAAIKKNKIRALSLPFNNGWVLALIFVALIFMKSLAALVFGSFLLFVILFLSPKRTTQLAVLMSVMFITYPLTSTLKIFPHDEIIDFAYSIDPERGQSLEFRFENEEVLLSHAREKPLFGWGGWGRNRVFDPETGEDLSVTDGKWVLTLGIRGWVGFLAEYMLIILPIWFAFKLQKQIGGVSKNEAMLLSAHSLITAIILVDQMPNASMNPLYLLLSGALLGRVYDLKQKMKLRSSSVKLKQV